MGESVFLRDDEAEFEFPVVRGTENEAGIDISKLRAQTGMVTLDDGFLNTGSCLSAITYIDGDAGILRYRGIPIEQLVHGHQPSFLETSYLLIHGNLPTRRARRLPLLDPQAHARPRGREAVLRRLPEGRAPDGDAVVGHHRALDLLSRQSRPEGPRRGRALDRPAHGQAADDRGLRVQEVDRSAVRVPEQQARPHRELPHDDVLAPERALRGQPDGREGAEGLAHPARRPRAELLHVDRAARRLQRGQHLRRDRRGHQRAVGPAARWREPGGHRDARRDPRRWRRHQQLRRAGEGPERPVPTLRLRASRVQELRPAPASSRPSPTR